MAILQGEEEANELLQKLFQASTPITDCDLIKPLSNENSSFQNKSKDFPRFNQISKEKEAVSFETVKLLNPKLAQKLRRKTLTLWLMPFGFITGLAFSQMTGLRTFSELGFPSQLEQLIGGFLGMGAGWIGGFFAAGNADKELDDDLRTLRQKSKEGLWLLLIETPMETELPWKTLKEINPIEIIKLNDY